MEVRPAGPDDADAVAEVFTASFETLTFLPMLHTHEEHRRFVGGLIERSEVWVAEDEGRIVGMAVLSAEMLDQFYVDPAAQRHGAGSALLDKAKERRPGGFTFWVFQQNEGARRFYERRGCRLVRLTDGSGNEERTPDALYEWRPGQRTGGSVTRALIVVDIQNDYFPGGAHPLVEPEAAAREARRLLDAFRASGEPVVHVQHVWDEPDAAFMRPGTAGVEIHELVAPGAGEPVVQKAHPNSFLDTDLEDLLRAQSVDSVVVCGMMTSMCVDATVRAASDLGFDTSVAHDACATLNLSFGGREVPAADVHAAFLAALAGGYARVASAEELAG